MIRRVYHVKVNWYFPGGGLLYYLNRHSLPMRKGYATNRREYTGDTARLIDVRVLLFK